MPRTIFRQVAEQPSQLTCSHSGIPEYKTRLQHIIHVDHDISVHVHYATTNSPMISKTPDKRDALNGA